jgi:molybdopterin/thiamine biosynthesis adenylyltransferase
MNAAAALARTIDLVRADVFPLADDDEIVKALTDVRIRVAGDERNLSSLAGQTAFVTTALVAAQSGATLVLDLPDVELLNQPPLRGSWLAEALIELTDDLIVPAVRDDATTCDVTVAIGSTAVANAPVGLARLSPTALGVELVVGDAGHGGAWIGDHLFAALFGGVAAGAEAFRAAMRRLAAAGHETNVAHAARAMRSVRLLVPEPKASRQIGQLDVISAGAITHGSLFALLRVPGVAADVRVFDDDVFDRPNLNRYLLGRRSWRGVNKAEQLATLSLPSLRIEAVPSRFDDELAEQTVLADTVAIGVDDIPSRWRVQRVAPGHVVVGATSHFEVVVSEHPPGAACARCLYPDGDDDNRPIPTVSFVSAFAGILQAYRLLGNPPPSGRQTRAAPVNLAGAEPLVELGVSARPGCEAGCRIRGQAKRGSRAA